MSNSQNIAVIGSGYWGKNLIRNYYELGALKLVCDKNETVLNIFKKQYPGMETCFALNDVLSRKEIEGVVIATPAETHYTLAREALLTGKHVYVEKPLVLHTTEGKKLTALADKKNLVLMVGHLLHYHPAFVKLKEKTLRGELGRINYIYSNRLNLGKIRREENILWSFAPHDISMILALAGEEPEAVHATGGNYLHKSIADVTVTHMEFPSGLHAHIFVSWLHPFKEQKLVVVGDKKMAVFNDTLPWKDKLLLYSHQINWENNAPLSVKGEAERVQLYESEPLRNECEHFLKCISTGSRPHTDGNEGLSVLKVLNAAQQSLDAVGMKIVLSLPETHDLQPATTPEGYFTHETAVIDKGSEIGSGTKIWHFSHILSGSKIGQNCNIGQNVVIGPDVTIGDGCKIQNNVSVYKGVTLQDGVFCGPSAVFTNIYNPRAKIRKMDQVRPTLVKHGATLGANCTIICGVTIGSFAFIGAAALVNRDASDYALVVGNPGKQIGWACECGEKLADDLTCTVCGKKYTEAEDGLILNS